MVVFSMMPHPITYMTVFREWATTIYGPRMILILAYNIVNATCSTGRLKSWEGMNILKHCFVGVKYASKKGNVYSSCLHVSYCKYASLMFNADSRAWLHFGRTNRLISNALSVCDISVSFILWGNFLEKRVVFLHGVYHDTMVFLYGV